LYPNITEYILLHAVLRTYEEKLEQHSVQCMPPSRPLNPQKLLRPPLIGGALRDAFV